MVLKFLFPPCSLFILLQEWKRLFSIFQSLTSFFEIVTIPSLIWNFPLEYFSLFHGPKMGCSDSSSFTSEKVLEEKREGKEYKEYHH